jgi:PPK2 family polyphosphate:nucleotide phosphotransferase
MPLDTSPYRVLPGQPADLAQRPTRIPDPYASKDEYEDLLKRQVRRLRDLQPQLYADDRYALLVILQAMDAAGKDGVIKHVLSGVNPQGVTVHSFKQPTPEELDHDFLWRTTTRLPERGRIGIFNRSYYEEVLVVRVHPEYLRGQRLPDTGADLSRLWAHRFRSIVEHEAHLHRNGTQIVKINLHLSRDEQRKRFLARLDEPDKRWKFSGGDVAERARWDDYQGAYASAIAATSTAEAPWYVIPADDKKTARLLVAQVLVETLERLDLHYPAVDPAELERYRAQLAPG